MENLLDKSYVEILTQRVLECPNKVFLTYKNENYTFKEINELSNKIANALKAKNIKKGEIVGIFLENSPLFIASFFALRKLGAIALFMHSYADLQEIIKTIADFKISCLCHNNADLKLENSLYLDENLDFSANFKDEDMDINSPCLVLLTSGSTGKPKGVIYTNKALNLSTKTLIEYFNPQKLSSFCSFMPFCHIGGFVDDFCHAFFINGTLNIVANKKNESFEERLNSIFSVCMKYSCDFLSAVPSLLSWLKNQPDYKEKIKSLKVIKFGAQNITFSQAKDFIKAFKDQELIFTYGMTELFPIAFVSSKDKENFLQKKLHFLPQICIKNPDEKIAELYLKAPYMAQGYFGNENFDFIKSGDLLEFYEKPYFSVIDRADDMIISNATHIYPSEILSAVLSFEDVSDAFVCGLDDEALWQVPACALITKKGFKLENLIEHLKQNISSYKIPKYFVFFDKFVYLENGKIDKSTLKRLIEQKIQG